MDVEVKILVKEQREKCGMSLRKLEAASGVTRGFISLVERGSSIPSIETLCKLAKAMKVPASDLFWYK